MDVVTWRKFSPHFTQEELLSPDGLLSPHVLDPLAVSKLNEFRERINLQLFINHGGSKLRGYRSPREHYNLLQHEPNAGELSMHCAGKAFDISCNEKTPAELAELAKSFGWAAIGIGKTFVHVDDRYLFGGPQVVWTYY